MRMENFWIKFLIFYKRIGFLGMMISHAQTSYRRSRLVEVSLGNVKYVLNNILYKKQKNSLYYECTKEVQNRNG